MPIDNVNTVQSKPFCSSYLTVHANGHTNCLAQINVNSMQFQSRCRGTL